MYNGNVNGHCYSGSWNWLTTIYIKVTLEKFPDSLSDVVELNFGIEKAPCKVQLESWIERRGLQRRAFEKRCCLLGDRFTCEGQDARFLLRTICLYNQQSGALLQISWCPLWRGGCLILEGATCLEGRAAILYQNSDFVSRSQAFKINLQTWLQGLISLKYSSVCFKLI